MAGGALGAGGTATTRAEPGAGTSRPAAVAESGGVRIVAKPVVYVFPASPQNGTAQFEVAVKLNRSPKALGDLRMTVTTVKGTVLAVDDLNARPFGRASRHCVLSRTLYDDTGKRHPQPGGRVRVQIDVSRGTKAHRAMRTARAYRGTEANSGSDAAFQRVAARRLGC